MALLLPELELGSELWGPTEGALNVTEGIQEGDYGKAAFGAVETAASVWGIRALAKNFASGGKGDARLIAEEKPPVPPQGPPQEPLQAELELTRFRRQPRYAATFAAACCFSKSIGLT
jgi:hypothetical protein